MLMYSTGFIMNVKLLGKYQSKSMLQISVMAHISSKCLITYDLVRRECMHTHPSIYISGKPSQPVNISSKIIFLLLFLACFEARLLK